MRIIEYAMKAPLCALYMHLHQNVLGGKARERVWYEAPLFADRMGEGLAACEHVRFTDLRLLMIG